MSRFLPELELALGADLTLSPTRWSWSSYTDHVHKPDKMIRRWGRRDRYSQVQASQVVVTLQNDAGIFVPDNPNSPLYGLIDINTPLRILNRAVATNVVDAFARTASSSWGSADSGGAWTNVGTAADYSVSSTNGGRHTHGSAGVAHVSTQAVSLSRVDITVRVRVNAASTGAAQTAGIVCRYVDANNSRRAEVQFGTTGTITGRVITRSSGTDTAVATVVSTLTHSTTSWYWVRMQTGVTSVRMKVWLDGTTEPRGWLIDGAQNTLLLNPVAGAAGVYSIREAGNTNASATIDFDTFGILDGPYIMQTVGVDAWPTEWTDISGVQCLAPITASGNLARIRLAKNSKSALFRAHTLEVYSSEPAAAVAGYWPMEDASGATQFASGLAGGPPMAYTDMTPGSVNAAGSDPLPAAGEAATFVAVVPVYPASTEWAVRAIMKYPLEPSVPTGVLAWTTGGTISKWALILNPGGTWTVQGYIGATEVLAAAAVPFADADSTPLLGQQLYMIANGVQVGTDILWSFLLCTATGASSHGGSYPGTIGNVTRIFHSAYPGLVAGGHVIGHVAVGADSSYSNLGNLVAAGYAAELTSDRLLRLGAGEGVSTFFGEILGAGSTFGTQMMGAQRTSSFYDQLVEIEATESGVLFDGRQGQVSILPRALRGNRAVGLALDIDAGNVWWPFRRTVDTQLLVNDVTVSNAGGSKAYASDAPLIRKVGVKPASIAVNTLNDSELDDHAHWWLHVGTNRDGRVPELPLNFARNPSLIGAYLEVDVGSRVQVTNLPAELPTDDLDLIAEGGEDIMDDHSWTATLNLSPGAIWDWWTIGDTLRGRVGPTKTSAGLSAHQLLTAATSSATSLLVATLEGRPLSTTAPPYHMKVGGEKITVTAVANGTPTLRAAGTASHGDNVTLTPALPAGAVLGDLLLVFAAIRNTLGTITTPAGYEVLFSVGHVAVLGKIHTGTESAPSVAFAGGAAGDTTSAQMGAFPFTHCRALYTASQTNGSAQNIAVPAMLPPRHRVLALWLGWKADDWTSVATLFGTEVGEPSTTTGNDQGLVWDYQYQATAAETAASSFVVTGGASAVSKGLVLVLPGDVQTATVTRSVNSVVKAQSAGTPLDLWKPGVLKL